MSIRALKDAVMREPSPKAAKTEQSGYPAFAAWRASEDAREGPREFAEKRALRWTSC